MSQKEVKQAEKHLRGAEKVRDGWAAKAGDLRMELDTIGVQIAGVEAQLGRAILDGEPTDAAESSLARLAARRGGLAAGLPQANTLLAQAQEDVSAAETAYAQAQAAELDEQLFENFSAALLALVDAERAATQGLALRDPIARLRAKGAKSQYGALLDILASWLQSLNQTLTHAGYYHAEYYSAVGAPSETERRQMMEDAFAKVNIAG
jgi:hypothetical protein